MAHFFEHHWINLPHIFPTVRPKKSYPLGYEVQSKNKKDQLASASMAAWSSAINWSMISSRASPAMILSSL